MSYRTSSSRHLAAAAGAVLGGLMLWSRLSAPTTPVTVIAGIDASRSMRAAPPGNGSLLGSARAALTDLASQLQPGFDRLVVARVDRETREFFDEGAPSGSEAFLQTLLDHTNRPPSVDGTFPVNFWRLAAQRAASTQEAPGAAVAIVFLTDGDNDDLTPQSHNAIHEAAQKLAANKRVVSVDFFGIDPKNWAETRDLFAPLGARLHLHPPQEMAPGELLARLEAARLEAARRAANASRS